MIDYKYIPRTNGIKLGQVYGRYMVIGFLRPRYVQVKCLVCGSSSETRTSALVHRSKRASGVPACSTVCRNNLIGSKLGDLTIVEDLGLRKYPNRGCGDHMVRAICICGTYRKLITRKLKDKRIKFYICPHKKLIHPSPVTIYNGFHDAYKMVSK